MPYFFEGNDSEKSVYTSDILPYMSNIALNKYGSGNTALIAFPGWIHPIENEKKFLDLLSKKYTVYSVCLPGYMKSPDANYFNDFSSLVDEIHTQLINIKEKKVYIGFSMGCRLIMELEEKFPSNYKKIFIGSPVRGYSIPLWAKVALINTYLLSLLRKFQVFKLFVIHTALRTITQDNKAIFKEKNVTITGAFDSLLGLIRSQIYFERYVKSAKFVYGEHDTYLRDAGEFEISDLSIIKNSGHNCVRDTEREVVQIIHTAIKN